MTTHWTRTWVLPGDEQGPRLAREALRTAFTGLPHGDDMVVVGSELVTNAIRHGRPPITLSVTGHDGRVRIEVRQGATGKSPVLLPIDPASPGGRGLAIVERLSQEWGWFHESGCLVVWAEFA